MSIKWMNYIWEERRDLEGSELLCAIAIADHADADGRCFPGLQTIADKLRCSKRQVTRLISTLEAKNVFKVERHFGRGQLTTFKFEKGDIDDTIKKGDKGDASDTFTDSEKVTSEAGKGDKSGEEKVTNPAPHYINHSSLTEEEPGRERHELLKVTEKILGYVPDLITQDRILDAVPDRFEKFWLDFVADRMTGHGDSDRNYVKTRFGYWLGDFRNNHWRYEKDLEVKNGSGRKPDPGAHQPTVEFNCNECGDIGHKTVLPPDNDLKKATRIPCPECSTEAKAA